MRGCRAAGGFRDAELLATLTGRLDSPHLAAPGVEPAGALMDGYRRALIFVLRALG